MPRLRGAPVSARAQKRPFRSAAEPRENRHACLSESVARPPVRVATADPKSIASPALHVPERAICRRDNRKVCQDSFDTAKSVMPDVVACNRELRNLVADRLDLVIVRHFGGIDSQSDIKSISARRVMGYRSWNSVARIVDLLRHARQRYLLFPTAAIESRSWVKTVRQMRRRTNVGGITWWWRLRSVRCFSQSLIVQFSWRS